MLEEVIIQCREELSINEFERRVRNMMERAQKLEMEAKE